MKKNLITVNEETQSEENEKTDEYSDKLELGYIPSNVEDIETIFIQHNLQNENIYNKSIKIILLGETKVGKTSLINRLCNNQYNENLPQTSSIQSYNYFVKVNEFILRMQIWDISGQEKNNPLINYYFQSTDYAIYLYSIDDKQSFYNLKDWLEHFQKKNDNVDARTILLGNKKDLDKQKRVVTYEQGETFAKEYKIITFNEISCKSDNEESKKNILDIFDNIAKFQYNYYRKSRISDGDCMDYEASNSIIKLGKKKKKKKEKNKKCCC